MNGCAHCHRHIVESVEAVDYLAEALPLAYRRLWENPGWFDECCQLLLNSGVNWVIKTEDHFLSWLRFRETDRLPSLWVSVRLSVVSVCSRCCVLCSACLSSIVCVSFFVYFSVHCTVFPSVCLSHAQADWPLPGPPRVHFDITYKNADIAKPLDDLPILQQPAYLPKTMTSPWRISHSLWLLNACSNPSWAEHQMYNAAGSVDGDIPTSDYYLHDFTIVVQNTFCFCNHFECNGSFLTHSTKPSLSASFTLIACHPHHVFFVKF